MNINTLTTIKLFVEQNTETFRHSFLVILGLLLLNGTISRIIINVSLFGYLGKMTFDTLHNTQDVDVQSMISLLKLWAMFSVLYFFQYMLSLTSNTLFGLVGVVIILMQIIGLNYLMTSPSSLEFIFDMFMSPIYMAYKPMVDSYYKMVDSKFGEYFPRPKEIVIETPDYNFYNHVANYYNKLKNMIIPTGQPTLIKTE